MSWTRTSGLHASQSSRAQAARLAFFLSKDVLNALAADLQSRTVLLIMHKKIVVVIWLQVPQDVLQKLLETLQENHFQEDEQFLGAVMPRLGNNEHFVAL